ncbi:MAG: polyphosphate polymerase domain-containing protein [Crocinitomicaceae bacterium]|nr:polyphosphate polymerase domain-containing protein [Crocinitomicaceae bacterium]
MLQERLKLLTDPFDAVNLAEMDAVALMNRIDTKYAIHENVFTEMLPELTEHYRILEVSGLKYSKYESLYFDSPNFEFFSDHHKKKNDRLKIRIRKYVNNNLSFLEVKRKKKGRTEKTRLKTEQWGTNFSQEELSFLENAYEGAKGLNSTISNSFSRITLVHKTKAERLTFDLNIEFQDAAETKSLTNLVICELKQGNIDRSSAFFMKMKKRMIRPLRVSKYCVGIMKFHPASELKQNRFKKKNLSINKIIC